MYVSKFEMDEIKNLAGKKKILILGVRNVLTWAYPFIEELFIKIEELEKRIKDLEK